MSIASNAVREFNKQISASLNSIVRVNLEMDSTKYYIGRLVGFETNSQSLCLENAKDEKHNSYEKIFIRGPAWATFSVEGEPFPMDQLAARLRKIIPGESINISEDNTISLLGGKLLVTENGVEGRGPTRERVQKVYDMFMADRK